MNIEARHSILLGRLLVGYLGERSHHGWWSTAFFEPSSRLFLEPVFARTTRLAQYCGLVEAARRLHDEHLSVGTYHLFRLPEEVEQGLHSLVQRTESDELFQAICDKDSAFEGLMDLAGAVSVRIVGPTAIGNIAELDAPNTVRTIAAAYVSAFTQDAKAYPYLVG